MTLSGGGTTRILAIQTTYDKVKRGEGKREEKGEGGEEERGEGEGEGERVGVGEGGRKRKRVVYV